MERITSSQNPLIRHIKKLQSSRAYREEQHEFVADGFKLLEEAVKWYPYLKTVVFVQGTTLPQLPASVRCVEVPEALMHRLSNMKTPQGVVFTCALPENTTPHISRKMLLLDRIQDPGNLGTILRTADAFEIPVILTNGCADPFSEKTVRASMGAVFRTIPQSLPMERILSVCAEQNIPIAATALTENATDLRKLDLKDYLVVIGSEGQGICSELLNRSEKQIIIPMQPRCESLNAAVAASVVMWQMLK